MIDITSQTTDLLQAIISVVVLVFVVMVVSNKLVHTVRKGLGE